MGQAATGSPGSFLTAQGCSGSPSPSTASPALFPPAQNGRRPDGCRSETPGPEGSWEYLGNEGNGKSLQTSTPHTRRCLWPVAGSRVPSCGLLWGAGEHALNHGPSIALFPPSRGWRFRCCFCGIFGTEGELWLSWQLQLREMAVGWLVGNVFPVRDLQRTKAAG